MNIAERMAELSTFQRILAILVLAVAASLAIRALRRLGEWVAAPRDSQGRGALRTPLHLSFRTSTPG